jgi:hypothetical protein
MLFPTYQAVTACPETSRFIGVSECGAPSPSRLIPAYIKPLGANSGANQLPRGSDWAEAVSIRISGALAYLKTAMRTSAFEPCIPTRGTKVPAGPDWLHEVKHDGYRLIV